MIAVVKLRSSALCNHPYPPNKATVSTGHSDSNYYYFYPFLPKMKVIEKLTSTQSVQCSCCTWIMDMLRHWRNQPRYEQGISSQFIYLQQWIPKQVETPIMGLWEDIWIKRSRDLGVCGKPTTPVTSVTVWAVGWWGGTKTPQIPRRQWLWNFEIFVWIFFPTKKSVIVTEEFLEVCGNFFSTNHSVEWMGNFLLLLTVQ